jgi:hypothetical protein
MLVEGGLIVLLFTATERSMSLAINAPPDLDYSQKSAEDLASPVAGNGSVPPLKSSRFKVDETVFFFEL